LVVAGDFVTTVVYTIIRYQSLLVQWNLRFFSQGQLLVSPAAGFLDAVEAHFTRDADDELPKFKERTLQRSSFGREARGAHAKPRTQLLTPAEIWRDLK